MSPDDGLLQDMLEEARLALTFASGMSEADFLRDVKTQHAVIRSLEVIGEAANQVSAATRAQLASVPWTEIIGQRHIAIHHYRKLQMPRIWRTVHEALPPLIAVLETHLNE
jgi:uncharacterized protein with HEPN domain